MIPDPSLFDEEAQGAAVPQTDANGNPMPVAPPQPPAIPPNMPQPHPLGPPQVAPPQGQDPLVKNYLNEMLAQNEKIKQAHKDYALQSIPNNIGSIFSNAGADLAKRAHDPSYEEENKRIYGDTVGRAQHNQDNIGQQFLLKHQLAKMSEAEAEKARNESEENDPNGFGAVAARKLLGTLDPEGSKMGRYANMTGGQFKRSGVGPELLQLHHQTTEELRYKAEIAHRHAEEMRQLARDEEAKRHNLAVEGNAGAKGSEKADEAVLKETDKIKKGLNQNIRSNTVMSKVQDRLNAFQRVEAEVPRTPDGKIAPMSPELVHSFINNLDSAIAMGAGSEAGKKGLMADTAALRWAKLKEQLTNKPQDAENGKFIQQYLDIGKIEQELARKQIKEAQLPTLGSEAAWAKKHPEEFWNTVKPFGISPSDVDENLQPKKAELPKAAAGAGKITVTNGKKTLRIEPKFLSDAEKDGYKEVP